MTYLHSFKMLQRMA